MEEIIPIRPCGHPVDTIMFFRDADGSVKVYCMLCLMERTGLKPVEQYRSVEEFIKAHGGKK